MKNSYYLTKIDNKSFKYNIYTNNIEYKSNNYITINNKKFYFIDYINFNKIKKGGTCYKFDIFKLGQISIEREFNNANLIFDTKMEIFDIKPPDKLTELKYDIDAFLHIFDFTSSNNIWNRPNRLAFVNNSNLTEDQKNNYIKYNILYNIITDDKCNYDSSNKEYKCDIIKKTLYSLDSTRTINKLLNDLNYYNKVKVINILIKLMHTIVELIIFNDFTDKNNLVDISQLNIPDNDYTKQFIESLKKIYKEKEGGAYNNYLNIIEQNKDYLDLNSKIIFIKNNKLYTTKKNKAKYIIINNIKLYPINILKGGVYTDKDIDDFISDIYITYNTIYESFLSNDTYLNKKVELLSFITYVIGFSNIFRYSGIINKSDSKKLNEYFHFYKYYFTLEDSIDTKSKYIEDMITNIAKIIINIRNILISYCNKISIVTQELLEKETEKETEKEKQKDARNKRAASRNTSH
tara:strand:- start:364 stop:1752 length:1389 start_codon:yes stop_codon:yes gene_type:complete